MVDTGSVRVAEDDNVGSETANQPWPNQVELLVGPGPAMQGPCAQRCSDASVRARRWSIPYPVAWRTSFGCLGSPPWTTGGQWGDWGSL